MNALTFAGRTLLRQPARATLGVLGIASVGALLFDMLLLSNGLLLSMRDLLDRSGFELRVTASPALPGTGPRLTDASPTAARLAALPEIDEAIALRFGTAEADAPGDGPPLRITLLGADLSRRREWTIVAGRNLTPSASPREVVINETMAETLRRSPGEMVTLRASCEAAQSALPPVAFKIAGIARFPFDTVTQLTAATSRLDIAFACGDANRDAADLILVATAAGFDPEQAREAIGRVDPTLAAMTNAEVVGRMDASGFSYFRQISAVLATVTGAFGLLLITVLLTVSVNQRLGTIAALRAIGLSRRRVVADVVCESALMVGVGGVLAVPLGFALAGWLDRILTRIPGLPGELHFFVFEPRALAVHAGVMAATALLAAVYPVRLVARLPIAATLREEVAS